MVLTILEATVSPERSADLIAAFKAAEKKGPPPGLVRSNLISASADPTLWRIETLWASREALTKMRESGTTPAGILMFRGAGAEPKLSLFDVAASFEAPK